MIKKVFAGIFWILFITVCQAQDNLVAKLDKELNTSKYDSLTAIPESKASDYPAGALYDIGMAWYMKDDDDNCISFMSLAIEKDTRMAKAYYQRGLSLLSIEKYLGAISDFRKAISIDPGNCDYYVALGDVYFKIPQYDSALACYKQGIARINATDRAYAMIAQTYAAQNKMDKALEAFYVLRDKTSQNSDYYKIALYNISVLEELNAHYNKAEQCAKECIKVTPSDYRSYSLLMQTYYGQKYYDSVIQLRDTLYKAWSKGRLRKTLQDRFCFDQFTWKDKRIEAYEKFETPRNKGDAKLVFVVFDKDGNIVSTIQTEYDPVLVELGTDMKYELGETIGNKDEIFARQYGNDINYDDLKQSVLDVLNGKLKPKSN